MRAVFQQQPEVAHLYLGSKRHMMQRIFSDENEPFWRSAKQMQLGVIAPEQFAGLHQRALRGNRRRIRPEGVDHALAITRGHPYGTQELCYFLWQRWGAERPASSRSRRRSRTCCARRTRTSGSSGGGRRRRSAPAPGARPGAGPPAQREYRRRFALPGPSTVQKALRPWSGDELVARDGGFAAISEPFLAEWIVRELDD